MDSNICNGNGNFKDIDICNCESEWEENNCSIKIFQCYGKKRDDPSICSGGVKYIQENLCKCNVYYVGVECTKDRLIVLYATADIFTFNWLCIIIVIFFLLV